MLEQLMDDSPLLTHIRQSGCGREYSQLAMLTSRMSAGAGDGRVFGFSERLVAEAVRLHEEARGAPLDEPRADEAARASAGDFERRVLVRAERLSVAQPLRAALRHLWAGITTAFAIGIVAAFAAGAASARVVLGSYTEGPVNFFLALAGLLGLHTIALLLWLIFIIFRPGNAAIGLLGRIILKVGGRVTRWLHEGPLELAAVRAAGSVFSSANLGRWVLSTISHSMWLAYLAGCLTLVLLLLSTRQYDFAWETTILSEPVYVKIARLIAWPVQTLGFPAPDAQQIGATRWTGKGPLPAEAREAWGGLLIGCIVVYGLLPRGLALLVSIAALLRARSRYRLDPGQVGFVRLHSRLTPLSKQTGVVDADEANDRDRAAATDIVAPAAIGTCGPTGILGLEIERPESGWPPDLPAVEWWDLGFADNRADRQRILDEAAAAGAAPRALLVVCSLAATPDRGIRTFVDTLRRSSRSPIVLLLTQGQRLRGRVHAAQVEHRIQDWRRLAGDAGIPAELVLELDLDHLTDTSRDRLAWLLGYGARSSSPTRRVDKAFALILEHATRWSGAPDMAEQAELQRAIAKLYGGGRQVWQDMLRARLSGVTPRLSDLRESSRRMVDLLPVRLRRTRWLAAGAVAGALGCVAAATVVAPAAIVALPAWAGLGAALSVIIGPGAPRPKEQPDAPADLTDAVNAAALFALVLELQGRDESEITRIIDRVAPGEDPPAMHDVPSARVWLDLLRGRLDQALASEGPEPPQ
jgi:hypothetical protein